MTVRSTESVASDAINFPCTGGAPYPPHSQARTIWSVFTVFLRSMCWLALLPGVGRSQDSQYSAAVEFVQRGQFEQALPILQQMLDRSPQDLKARNLLGIALSGAGRGAEAAEQFKQVLELRPDFVPALKNLGINELRLGRAKDAALHLEQALKLAPGDPACNWGLAEVAFGERRFQGAADHYEQSGELALQDPRVMLRFATSYVEIKQLAKAAALLDKLPSDVDPKTQFQTGLILARLEKYEDARRRFELARSGYPDLYEVDYNLMLVSIKKGDSGAAVQIGQDMLTKGYGKAELYSLLAQAYAGSGKMNEAYEALRTATSLEPLDETNYLDLIALCLEHRLYDRGLEIADIGIRLIPASDRLHIDRGVALVMKGNLDEAEKEFQAAQELSPKGLAGVAIGLVLLQADKLPEAIAALRRQIARNPSDPWAAWLLAEALYRTDATPGGQQEGEAIEALNKSILLDVRLAQPRALLGKILLHRGDLDRALEELNRAMELDPGDVSTEYLLGQAYQKKGDHARAKELFAKVDKAKHSDLETTQRNLMRMIKPQ